MNHLIFRLLTGVVLGLSILLSDLAIAATIPTDRITLLYRKESADAPKRQDPTILAATRALERELLKRNYKIPPTPADVLKALDQSSTVIVSFAPDAGFSMMYSIYKNLRPDPGVNTSAVEVAISARVFIGAGLLSTEEGRAVIRVRGNKQQREYGDPRTMKRAVERAASNLVRRIDARLRALTPEQIEEFAQLAIVEDTQIADAAPLPPPSGAAPLPRPAVIHALVIGVSDYRNASRINKRHINNLKGVAVDIQKMADIFAKLGVAKKRITVLKNSDATIANVRKKIASIAKAAGPNDLFVVYISGHGMQADFKRQGMSLPVFYDFSFEQQESAPDFAELLEEMTKSAADRFVMILDTCHSGGAASVLPYVVVISSGGASISHASGAPAAHMLARSLNTTRNIAVLSSASVKEYAWGLPDGGLFTTHLIKGLLNTRGKEVLREMMEKHVAAPVIEKSKKICARQEKEMCPTGQQTPTLGFSGGGDMIRM